VKINVQNVRWSIIAIRNVKWNIGLTTKNIAFEKLLECIINYRKHQNCISFSSIGSISLSEN